MSDQREAIMPFVAIDELTAEQLLRLIYRKQSALEAKMSEISTATARLSASVNQAVALIREGSSDQSARVAELEAAIAAEREAATALAASEDAEDVEQNAALADARAEVDRLTTDLVGAAGDINAQADALERAIASRDSGVDEPGTDGSTGATPAPEVPVAEPEPTPANDGDGSLPEGSGPGEDVTEGGTPDTEVDTTPTTGVDEPATTPEAPTSADESGNTTNA